MKLNKFNRRETPMNVYYRLLGRVRYLFQYIPTIPRRFIYASKWFLRTWNSPNWDYKYLIGVIGYKIEDMSKELVTSTFDRYDLEDTRDCYVAMQRLQLCARLFKRIREANYNYDVPESGTKKFKDKHMWLFPEDRDMRLAVKLISKYYYYWWD